MTRDPQAEAARLRAIHTPNLDAKDFRPPCDYCAYGDTPVCGVAGCRDDPIEEPAHWSVAECTEVQSPHRCRDGFHHSRQPVHLIPDPEGLEGTWKIRCSRSTEK